MIDGELVMAPGTGALAHALATARAVTVWVAHSSRDTAEGLATALRSHTHLDVRLFCRGADAADPSSHDLLIVDPAYLHSMVVDQRAGARPAPTAHRGGLAPFALRRVKAAIEERLSQGIPLAELARIAGLSECHFARAFKQSVGIPPHRYLLQRRLDLAATLIRDTDRPLTDIALTAGFSDHSHFTRCFARHRRETPSAFRRRHR